MQKNSGDLVVKPLFVVGGVAGCGKSTLAAALARALDVAFRDGDDLHPPTNKAKMAAGEALTDTDRAPWLAACAAQLAEWGDGGGVISASALRRAYREILYAAHPGVIYVLIDITPECAASRAAVRPSHFWPASLTASQFAILEPPGADERALRVAAERPTDQQVAAICVAISSPRA